MASYEGALFTIEDLVEDPYVELFGRQFYMRHPQGFSLFDNNKAVNLSNKFSRLEKMGRLNEVAIEEVEEAADNFLRHIAREEHVLDELLADERFKFMIKLRIIRKFNEIFSEAMTFREDQATEETADLEMIDR